MKADPARQERLLDLQALDTRLDQIDHRTSHLPEAATAAGAAQSLATLDSELTRARIDHDDLGREVTKAEDAVQLVRDRSDRNRARLEAGQGSPKDLQAMQQELSSLARRQGDLEDAELEAMERLEGAAERVAALEERRPALAEALESAETAREGAMATLVQEREELTSRRGEIAAGVGDDLLALYEKVRAATGTGAAALRARRCEGCHLELMQADLRRIAAAAPDEVVRCEECRRILVRTAESGL